MAILIILLVLIAVILAALEIFVIPGFGVTGIASLVCLVVATYIAAGEYGTFVALFGFLVLLAVFVAAAWLFARSKAMERIALTAEIDSSNATKEQLSVGVGEEGVAVTRLALMGQAKFDGRIVEVRSIDGFIDEGTPVVVERVNKNGAQIMVRRLFR